MLALPTVIVDKPLCCHCFTFPACFMWPSLQILQPHMFDFVRVAFFKSQLHANSTAYALCIDLWLLWLQPW